MDASPLALRCRRPAPHRALSRLRGSDREGARDKIEHFRPPPPPPSAASGRGSTPGLPLALNSLQPRPLFRLDVGGLGDPRPARDLLAHPGIELLRRVPEGEDAEIAHLLRELR